MEAEFRHTPGVVATEVGYTGGHKNHPTYENVCAGHTGHAEAVLVEFDPQRISYDRLLEVFWSSHSPEYQRKGQYRSAVFTYGPEQAELATLSMARLERKLARSISTRIEPAQTFWRAEEYHQQYFEKSGAESCPIN